MTLKFEELIPVKSFAFKGAPSPFINIGVLDLTGARDGYKFHSLTSMEQAPHYRLRLVNKESAMPLDIWFRFPSGIPNPDLDRSVMIERTAHWLDNIRRAAERELGVELVLSNRVSNFSLFDSVFRTDHRIESPEHFVAERLIHSFMKHLDRASFPAGVSINCYETVSGRRYEISGCVDEYFSFSIKSLSSEELIRRGLIRRGLLYGTCQIKGAKYHFEMFHSVLQEQLPSYYDAFALRKIVDLHMERYAKEFFDAVKSEDDPAELYFEFDGLRK